MIVVTGMPRAGTTLMMKMLHSAGVECYGHPVTMETPHSVELPKDSDWLKEVGGAVKILNIGKHYPPAGDYKFIWMRRDEDEQVLSMKKYMSDLLGLRHPKNWKARYKKRLMEGTYMGLDTCRKLGDLHIQSYEDVLEGGIDSLAEFTGLDRELLMAPVWKRSARCAEGFIGKNYYGPWNELTHGKQE